MIDRAPQPDDRALLSLLASLVDGSLDAKGRAELERILEADPAARRTYLHYLDAHCEIADALNSHLAAPRGEPREALPAPGLRFSVSNLKFAALAATLLLAAAAVAVYYATLTPDPRPLTPDSSAPIATVLDTTPGSTLLVDDTIVNSGDDIRSGTLSLDAGSADFRLTNGVAVTLRGQTHLTVHSPMSATLTRGTAAFDCPPAAVGYTVSTPDGMRVVDLGTRFIVTIDDAGRSRVSVLEGAVDAAATAAGLKLGVYEAAEVRDGRVVRTAAVLPGDLAGYATTDATGGVASRVRLVRQTGMWFGESVRVVGPTQGIRPFDGPSMLQFICTDSAGPAATGGSEVYQAIDLRPYRQLIDAGRLSVRLTARFNRVAGDAQTDTQFMLAVFAHSGPLAGFNPDANPKAGGAQVATDADLTTWQTVSAEGKLPPGTDFAVVELLTVENVFNDRKGVEFDGHYADGVEVELIVAPPVEAQPTPAEATPEADHNPAGRNHESTVPDSR